MNSLKPDIRSGFSTLELVSSKEVQSSIFAFSEHHVNTVATQDKGISARRTHSACTARAGRQMSLEQTTDTVANQDQKRMHHSRIEVFGMESPENQLRWP